MNITKSSFAALPFQLFGGIIKSCPYYYILHIVHQHVYDTFTPELSLKLYILERRDTFPRFQTD